MVQLTLQQACLRFVNELATTTEEAAAATSRELQQHFRTSPFYSTDYNGHSERALALAIGQAVTSSPFWLRVKKGVYQRSQTPAEANPADQPSNDNIEAPLASSTVQSDHSLNIRQQVERYGWNEKRDEMIEYVAQQLYLNIQRKASIEDERLRGYELSVPALHITLQYLMESFFEVERLGSSMEKMCDFISLAAYKALHKKKKKRKLVLDYVVPSGQYLKNFAQQGLNGTLSSGFVQEVLNDGLFTCVLTKAEAKKLDQINDEGLDAAVQSKLLYRYEAASIPFMFNAWAIEDAGSNPEA